MAIRKRKFILFLLLIHLLYLPYCLKAQNHKQATDQLLKSYNQKNQFDGSILIAKGDQIVYQNYQGMANRQFKVPVNQSTKFPMASITKLFTAVLILKLQEERQLNIDSSLSHYAPDILPKNGDKITIRQLLTHLSGLPGENVSAYTRRYPIKQFLQVIHADTLISKPGTKYRYNNVGFIVLGALIEQITHQSWQQVLQEKIIDPLKLKHTGLVEHDKVIENLAYGYHNYAFGNLPASPLINDDMIYMENYATAAALYTTAQDLFRFHLALAHNEILTEASRQLMYMPDLKTGKVENAEYYVTLGSYRGDHKFKNFPKAIPVIERPGSVNGYNSAYIQLPENKITLIIFCNTDAGSISGITDQILSIWLSPQI